MKTKLIVALVDDAKTDTVVDAARAAGATGATVITSARGEGRSVKKTFLGLELASKCDVLLFLVSEAHAPAVLKGIHDAGQFDGEPGAGIAFQIDVEEAVGLASQMAGGESAE
ncbi:MAG: P-II family nitrogen regulator [Gammaproteobacteria bacterium]|nr:P-II family nitrogen regulator [Gammaproteobacteria bacterium]